MADFRSVKCAMWREDDWFQSLEADERLLFIYLFTNPSASVAGIYKLPLRTIAFESGIPESRIAEIMTRFAQDGKAFYESGIVWVRRMREHQLPGIISPKLQTRLEKDVLLIPDCQLKTRYLQVYHPQNDVSIQYGYPMDTVSIPRATDTDTDTDTETETETDTIAPHTAPDQQAPPPTRTTAEQKPKPAGKVISPVREDGTTQQTMFGKIAEICDMDANALTSAVKSQIGGAAKQLIAAGATADRLTQFRQWWDRTDWRGKKHQAPTPPQIVVEWPKFSANGNKTGNAALDTMIREGLWQPGQPL